MGNGVHDRNRKVKYLTLSSFLFFVHTTLINQESHSLDSKTKESKSMSIGKTTSLLVLMIVLPVLSSFGPSYGSNDLSPGSTRGEYQLHDPILIDGDDKFTTENGVISGTGTESDPYIIESWDLGNASLLGIGLRNTTKHVTIKNCWFHNAFGGVSLVNVKNAAIERNIFQNNSLFHVALEGSDYNSIRFNLMEQTYVSGIELKGDNNWNDILDNEIKGFGFYGTGILLEGTGNNCTRVIGNEVSNFDSGIHIHDGFNMIIRNNSCHHNRNEGLYLNNSGQSIIAGNRLCNNYGDGFCYIESYDLLIFNNFIEMNQKNGIVTTATSRLFYNSIRNNLWSGIYGLNGHLPDLFKNIVQGNGRYDAENKTKGIMISDIVYVNYSHPFLAKVDPNVTIPIMEVPIVGLREFDFHEEYHECLFYYSPYEEGIEDRIYGAGISVHNVPSDYSIEGYPGPKAHLIDPALMSFNYSSRSGPSYFIVTYEFYSGYESFWNITMNYIPRVKTNDTNNTVDPTEPGNTTDDPSDGNDTIVQNWTRETNRDPVNVSIGLPDEVIQGGKAFLLTASSLDPDQPQGDSVRYEWYIDGIGFVGEGEVLNLTLEKGTYTIRLRAIDSLNGTCEISMVLEVTGRGEVEGRSILPFVLIASGLILFLCVVSLFIYRRERKRRDEAPSEFDHSMDIATPRTTPRTFEGGLATQVGPERLSAEGNLCTGPMDLQFETMRERMVYSELEHSPFEGVKRPRGPRRRELKRLLRARKDIYDGEVYSALRSILDEE